MAKVGAPKGTIPFNKGKKMWGKDGLTGKEYPMRGKSPSKKTRDKISRSLLKYHIQRENLQKLYNDKKLSRNEVAKRLGVSGWAVSYWMKKYGISCRTLSEATRFSMRKLRKQGVTKEILKDLYHRKKWNSTEIANKFGVTTKTITDWMRKFNIPRRTVSESQRYHLPKSAKIHNRDLGYIIGVVIGDGHITHKKIHLNSISHEFVDNFRKILERWSGKSLSIKDRPQPEQQNFNGKIYHCKKQYTVELFSVEASKLISQYVNGDFNTFSREMKKGLIEGFLDSEGNVYDYTHSAGYNQVKVFNSNSSLLDKLKDIMEQFGIKYIKKYSSISGMGTKMYNLALYRQAEIEKFCNIFNSSVKVRNFMNKCSA